MSWFVYAAEPAVRAGGFTAKADDVRLWLRFLRSFSDPTIGLLGDLEGLANGELPAAQLRLQQPSSRVRIQPGPDLPKQIRLAHAVQAFRLATSSTTPVTRASVDSWIDVERVEAYERLELDLHERIASVAIRLEMSLRRPAFARALQRFTPMQLMQCVVDVVPVLVQTGQLATSVRHGCPLFTDERLTQVFDLFELHDPGDQPATQVLSVRFDAPRPVRWGSQVIEDRALAERLMADVAAPKKVLETYKLYRESIIPALMIIHLERGTPLTVFSEEIGDLVKRSTLPFYPRGALDRSLPLADFKAQLAQYDADNPARWRRYDTILASGLDRAATATSSILGILDLGVASMRYVAADDPSAADLADLLQALLAFVDDGLSLGVLQDARVSLQVGKSTVSLSSAFTRRFLARVLFAFAVYDTAVSARAVSTATSKAELVGASLMLAGSVVGVGASGIALLAQAGLITVGAGPIVVAGLVAGALGLLGWAVIALFGQDYPEQILRGGFFRRDPNDQAAALRADREAVDLRTGFVTVVDGDVRENLSLQIAYTVGLTRGFGPSATDLTPLLQSRRVEYQISRTPNSATPPAVASDIAFASGISVQNMDLDVHGRGVVGSPEARIRRALFETFENPVVAVTMDGEKPPLELEIRTYFREETLTFEPLRRTILQWLSQNVVAAGGQAPTWRPGPAERLEIRERTKAVR